MVRQSVTFIKSYITEKARLTTHGLRYDRESTKVWMVSINNFVGRLQEEIKTS